jgi:hypothetical protein
LVVPSTIWNHFIDKSFSFKVTVTLPFLLIFLPFIFADFTFLNALSTLLWRWWTLFSNTIFLHCLESCVFESLLSNQYACFALHCLFSFYVYREIWSYALKERDVWTSTNFISGNILFVLWGFYLFASCLLLRIEPTAHSC